MASGKWIIDNLNNALNTWNEKLAEIWNLITQSPETFKGGAVWGVILNIHGAAQAIGLGLLVLFFVVGVMKTLGSFAGWEFYDGKAEANTETLFTIGRKHLCQFATLKHQQMDGLNTALPYGLRKIDALRTLTTESVAVFVPFRVQEVSDKGGICYGVNAISRNMIICDKRNILNANAFRLGVPGSGKSFGAKEAIVFLAVTTDDDILVCDPEGEFGALVKALGGEVIRIAAGSADHINAMNMAEGYGDSGSGYTMPMAVAETNTEYADKIGEIKADNPHDDISLSGSRASWKDILAVYAVKTAAEMADRYGFTDDRKARLAELLSDEYAEMWAAVLYGIRDGGADIVAVAVSQIGNAGGLPYWSWYGFASRAEWCACFVSWCANEAGYIEAGILPKFAGCQSQGVPWFRDRGLWR